MSPMQWFVAIVLAWCAGAAFVLWCGCVVAKRADERAERVNHHLPADYAARLRSADMQAREHRRSRARL